MNEFSQLITELKQQYPDLTIRDFSLDMPNKPPIALLSLITEYMIRYQYILYPFRLSDEQKEQKQDNRNSRLRLESRIAQLGYSGTFVFYVAGFCVIGNIDFTKEDRSDFIQCTLVPVLNKPDQEAAAI